MITIETHINQVQSLLNELDLKKKCQFSAWCCNDILKNENIKQTLFEITKTHANYQMLQAVISACWYDYTLINHKPTLELLDEMQFNSEEYPNFWLELESLNELLIAVECIINGILSNDTLYFANVAENLINYKDLLAEYPISDDGFIEKQNYQKEYDIQIQFLNDLKDNEIDDLNKYRD